MIDHDIMSWAGIANSEAICMDLLLATKLDSLDMCHN
jgi:hypothetical protein